MLLTSRNAESQNNTRADVRDWHANLLRSVKDRPKAKAYAVLRAMMNAAAETSS